MEIQTDILKLCKISREALEMNSCLLTTVSYQQELIVSIADSLVKISRVSSLPVDAREEIAVMLSRMSNFQNVLKEKMQKDLQGGLVCQ